MQLMSHSTLRPIRGVHPRSSCSANRPSRRSGSHRVVSASSGLLTSRSAVCASASVRSSVPAELEKIISGFQMVPDPKIKYQQLLFYAKKLKPMAAALHTEDNKVQGCVSQVWVHPHVDDGKIFWEADSDSALTKGLAALLVQGLSGSTAQDIVAIPPDFIDRLGLQQSLTPSRNNGFLNMFRLMQRKSLDMLQQQEHSPQEAAKMPKPVPADSKAEQPVDSTADLKAQENQEDAQAQQLAAEAARQQSQSDTNPAGPTGPVGPQSSPAPAASSAAAAAPAPAAATEPSSAAAEEPAFSAAAASSAPPAAPSSSAAEGGAEGAPAGPSGIEPAAIPSQTPMQALEAALQEAFVPTMLEVQHQQEEECGQTGTSSQSEILIRLTSELFEGQDESMRHSMVKQVVECEMPTTIGKLSIHARAPSEAESQKQ